MYTHFQHVITNVLELMYVNLRSETFHTYPPAATGGLLPKGWRGGRGHSSEQPCFEQKNAWSRFALILFELGKLILRKIIKLLPPDVILKLKCTKIDFGWGSAPHPAGELTVLPQTP